MNFASTSLDRAIQDRIKINRAEHQVPTQSFDTLEELKDPWVSAHLIELCPWRLQVGTSQVQASELNLKYRPNLIEKGAK